MKPVKEEIAEVEHETRARYPMYPDFRLPGESLDEWRFVVARIRRSAVAFWFSNVEAAVYIKAAK